MRDPWRSLETNWPWIEIYIRRLPDVWGRTIWPANGKPYIELAHDLGPIQQRCTLAHEMHHLELGQPCTSMCVENERRVREATARWLLPDMAELGAALAKWSVTVAAERLAVSTQVLADRLVTLTGAEEAELASALPQAVAKNVLTAADGPRRSAVSRPSCRRQTPPRPQPRRAQ